MTYRGDEASEARLKALDEQIEALHAQFTDVFWQRVAPVWGVLPGLDPALSPLEARHDRISRLEDAIERTHRGPPAEPEMPVLPPVPEGVFASIGRALRYLPPEVTKRVVGAAKTYDADAELSPRGWGDWGMALRVKGAPIELRLTYEQSSDKSYVVLRVSTSIAPAAHLTLEPEGILQDLLEMIGIRTEIEIGDPRFDPSFVIKGDAATAEAFLTKQIRKQLLVVGEEDTPRVTLVGGYARVRTGATSRRSVLRLLDVLATWHTMPSPLPLLV